jgi:hypothetical protein
MVCRIKARAGFFKVLSKGSTCVVLGIESQDGVHTGERKETERRLQLAFFLQIYFLVATSHKCRDIPSASDVTSEEGFLPRSATGSH